MKGIKFTFLVVILVIFSTAKGFADFNQQVSFINDSDESLYVELMIEDGSGWTVYNLYIEPYGCSDADFWSPTPFALFTACADGVHSDDFYGCLDGSVSDSNIAITFQIAQAPYFDDAPWQSCDTYVFDSYHSEPSVIIEAGDDDHLSVSCFADTLLARP